MSSLTPEASDLVLHADSDRNLYHQSHMPILKNLQGKMKKGVYDHEAAKTLWGYHADRAAKSYTKEFGSPGDKWHEMFSPLCAARRHRIGPTGNVTKCNVEIIT